MKSFFNFLLWKNTGRIIWFGSSICNSAFTYLIHLIKSCISLGIIYFGQIFSLQLSTLLVHNKNICSSNQLYSKHVVEHIALEVNWNRGPPFSSPSCKNAKQPKQGTPFCRPPNKILASIYIIINCHYWKWFLLLFSTFGKMMEIYRPFNNRALRYRKSAGDSDWLNEGRRRKILYTMLPRQEFLEAKNCCSFPGFSKYNFEFDIDHGKLFRFKNILSN